MCHYQKYALFHFHSHLRPLNDIWEISRKIRNDKASFDFWRESSVQDIIMEHTKKSKKYFIPELINNIEKYGYHSDKELNVTYPYYLEDPASVISSFKETILLSDENSPINDHKMQLEKYEIELDKLSRIVKPFKYEKLERELKK